MIPAQLYSIVFLYIVVVLTIFVSLKLSGQTYNTIRHGDNNSVFALGLCMILALWIGMRPSWWGFGDSVLYEHVFNLMKNDIPDAYGESAEIVWNTITYYCSQTMDVSAYFTIISFGYFGFTYLACRIFTPNNVLVSVLFMLGAFSFYAYGTNGLRNGLACSITLFIIAFMSCSNKNLPIALIFVFLAINIHRTTLLPLTSLFASVYVIKSFKWAYIFWLLSILISLVAGGAMTTMFAGLGFDDRLSYLTDYDIGMFSHTGFRWDFLLYSMMPIVLGYYVVIKRGIQDRTYTILLNTYTLANAFWVMVIRANYSNRFAYLSWFMYPIVLAYPLLRLDVWGDMQGKRLKQIMLAHIRFTWFMATF